MAKYLILIFLIIFSCSQKEEDQNNFIQKDNPLDEILGDKILDHSTKEIRPNNFNKIIGINEKWLKSDTKLYNIDQLSNKTYLINQIKQYTEARSFSLLVNIENSKISNYIVINDYRVIDFTSHSNSHYLLCGDFGFMNSFWKAQNHFKIIKINDNLKTIWTYEPSRSSFDFEVEDINYSKGEIVTSVNIITGCHICYNIIELTLDKDGEFKSANQIRNNNSSLDFSESELKEVFN